MKTRNLLLTLASLVLSVATASKQLHSNLRVASSPTNYFYTVRRDLRKCASPLCGGYFLSAVNRQNTRCADGSLNTECYAADLDFSGAASSALDQQKLQNQVEGSSKNNVIIQGSFDLSNDNGSSGVYEFKVVTVYAPIEPTCKCGEDEICTYDTSSDCEGCDCPTVCRSKSDVSCGGFAGISCPNKLICVDDPNDSCNPKAGGADCSGLCQATCDSSDTRCVKEIGGFCGGIAGFMCGPGLECVEDISGGCSSRCGGADCGGVCLPVAN